MNHLVHKLNVNDAVSDAQSGGSEAESELSLCFMFDFSNQLIQSFKHRSTEAFMDL